MPAEASKDGGHRSLRVNGHPGIGFKEFVALMAALMAVNALSSDAMLPVLPQMGDSLGGTSENQQQWIVTSYLLGFGGGQLFYGPLADRFGRKSILLAGLGAYAIFTIAAAFAASLEVMVVLRALQGAGAAAPQVLTISIIRDCYSGRRMARVMSLTFIVFLAAPVFAPAFGEAVAVVAPWQWIFAALAAFGVAAAIWAMLRLPETLDPAHRRAVSLAGFSEALRLVFSQRIVLGYMTALTAIFGALFGFINSSEQVFAEALQAPELFTTVFALVRGCMAVGPLLNACVVERIGRRRVSHAALIGFIAVSSVHAAMALAGQETVWTFAILQAASMFCFGLVVVNFNAIAMEPLGTIAGTGSSVLGSVTTVGGALIGFAVGQQFNDTVVPLTLAFVGCGLAALLIVIVTEKGRLFRPPQTAG